MYSHYIVKELDLLLDTKNRRNINCLKDGDELSPAEISAFKLDYTNNVICSSGIPSQFPPQNSKIPAALFTSFLSAMQKSRKNHGLHSCNGKEKFKNALIGQG